MRSKPKLILSLAVFSVLMICAVPAFGYIDPGTGSMLIQAAIAVIAGACVSIGIFWNRLRSWVKSLFSRTSVKKISDDS